MDFVDLGGPRILRQDSSTVVPSGSLCQPSDHRGVDGQD
jgi:hypothetical protein